MTADGVDVKTALSQVTYQWEAFPEAIERPDSYLLRRGGPTSYLVIPKRTFLDADVEQRFRTLVNNHVMTQFRPLAEAEVS